MSMSDNSKLNIELFLAALLQGDNYMLAAARALKLAAAYESLLAQRSAEWELERDNVGCNWAVGVKLITGHVRLARAEKSFARLCSHLGLDDLEAWRKSGFHPDELAYLRDRFARHFLNRKEFSKKVLAPRKRPQKASKKPRFRA